MVYGFAGFGFQLSASGFQFVYSLQCDGLGFSIQDVKFRVNFRNFDLRFMCWGISV